MTMDPNAEGAVPPEDTNMQAAAPPQDAPPGVMHPGQMDMLGQPPQDGFVVDAEAGIGVMKVDPESIPTTTAGVPPTETPAPEVPPPAEQPVVDSVVKAEIAEGTTDDRPATQSKKRMSKPVKKVLYAKKESDMAAAFISGKKDLSGILNKDDCRFVAHSFYCFTLDQLDYIVKTGLGEDSKDKTMILSKMENSSSNVLTIPEEPKEEAPVEGEAPKEGDAMDVDPKPDGEEKPSEEPAAAPEATAEPEELREKAIKKLEYWQTIASQARDAPSSLSISESFPLDGAVQILFPATVSNFLKSVQITSLMAWLSLKKTETGKICEYFLRWRVKCGYGQVPPLGVAKYLLGVSNRIETFISANPPIDEETRNWMLDPIVVMTGAARDFLVEDQKITTAFDFVHTRTKDLSLALADWREKKGFEPLKGSGKVAMISGWKATAREVLEIEQGYGKALTDPEDLAGLDLSEEEVGTPMDLTPLPSRKARRSMGSVVSVNDPNAPLEITSERKLKRKKTEYNLHSKFYLDETLGEEETDLLAGIDIHTAAQFLEIDEEIRGYLVEEIVDAKMAADAEAAGALIDQWKLTMEEDLGPYKNFAKKKRKLNPEAARAASQARKTRSSERGSGKKSKVRVMKLERRPIDFLLN